MYTSKSLKSTSNRFEGFWDKVNDLWLNKRWSDKQYYLLTVIIGFLWRRARTESISDPDEAKNPPFFIIESAHIIIALTARI